MHRREQANAAQASTIERALKPADGVRRQGVQHRVAVEAIGERGHRLLHGGFIARDAGDDGSALDP